MHEGGQIGLPVAIVYDGSELARKTIRSTLDLIYQHQGYLIVIVVAEDVETARSCKVSLPIYSVRTISTFTTAGWCKPASPG